MGCSPALPHFAAASTMKAQRDGLGSRAGSGEGVGAPVNLLSPEGASSRGPRRPQKRRLLSCCSR